jgi:hypothetical protein
MVEQPEAEWTAIAALGERGCRPGGFRSRSTTGRFAASRGPGWCILRGLCGAVWLYLGLVAALVLPHHPGSWGRMAAPLRFWSASDSASPLGADLNRK